nr:168_t:CDS:2 [Entrophospora candida]
MLPLKNIATSLLSSSSSSPLSPRFVSSSSVNTEVYNHSIFDPVESEPSVQDNTQCSTQEAMTEQCSDSVRFESSESNIDVRRFYYGENQIDYDNQYADDLFNFY